MLGAESSQAERRNVANANLNSKRMPVMLDLFLMGHDLDRVRVPQHYGHSLFEFNLHHLDESDGKTSGLRRGIETLEHFVSVSIRSFLDEDHIDKPVTSCKRTSLFPNVDHSAHNTRLLLKASLKVTRIGGG